MIFDESDALRQFAILDDGSVRETRYHGEEPLLPAPGRIVGEAEYRKVLTAIQAAVDEHWDGVLTEERERQTEDYEALRAAGVAEGTARRMSGYTPSEESEQA